MKDSYRSVSGLIFGAVALLQLVRVLSQWQVQIGPFAVPILFSIVAVAISGAMCAWAFLPSRR